MKHAKNIAIGFLVSFIGSLPLGYLNVVGFHLFQNSGINNLILCLIGVAVVETIVICLSLVFARQLALNKKLLGYIEIFSVVFMFMLAGYFAYEASVQRTGEPQYIETLDDYHPFITGLMLSGLNFIQIPFWVGWNLYLINNKYIRSSGLYKYAFVVGAAIGTFFGMLSFVLLLSRVSNGSNPNATLIVARAIPIIFFGMAIFGTYSYFKKRRRKEV